jgi:hypothetical protein
MSQPRENDLGLPPAFIEWVDEIIECNLTLSLPELQRYIFRTTGELFTEGYLKRARRHVSSIINRADRYPDDNHPLWVGSH